LSTGLRINSAKDDAAGLQISTRLTSKVNELKKGLQNIKDGISFLETADGKLAIVLEHLQRAKELSIKAQNGTYSSKDIQAIQEEFDSIKSSIDQIINSSTFNNKEIFSSGNGIYIDNGNSAVKILTKVKEIF
jgi:flagellin